MANFATPPARGGAKHDRPTRRPSSLRQPARAMPTRVMPPLATMSVFLFFTSVVLRGQIDDVGFTKRATSGWPVEMPPITPRHDWPEIPACRRTFASRRRFPANKGGANPVANLHTLPRIDAHQGGGEFRIQLAIDRCAEACGNPVGHHFDDCTTRTAAFA